MAIEWSAALSGIGAAATLIREVAADKAGALRERLDIAADRLELAKDQIAFHRDMLAGKESRVAELEKELTELRSENGDLKAKVGALLKDDQGYTFEERGGFVFRRSANGTWSDNTFCPNCRMVLTRAFSNLTCTSCNWTSIGGTGKASTALAGLKQESARTGVVATEYELFKDS